MRITFVFAAVLLCAAYPVQAQIAGQRVRVTDASGARIVGTVHEMGQDSLTMSLDGDLMHRISFSEMGALDTSLGRRTYRKVGALAGVGAGALIGIGVGVFFADVCDDTEFTETTEFGTITVETEGCEGFGLSAGLIATALYGSVGALVGIGVGSLIKGERWTALPIPGRGAANLEPIIRVHATGNPVFGARLTF